MPGLFIFPNGSYALLKSLKYRLYLIDKFANLGNQWTYDPFIKVKQIAVIPFLPEVEQFRVKLTKLFIKHTFSHKHKSKLTPCTIMRFCLNIVLVLSRLELHLSTEVKISK